MDKMLSIGLKKGCFSIEEIFNLIYGEITKGKKSTWHSKATFRLVPVSYRKELIKKISKTDSGILNEAARALLENRVALMKMNSFLHWTNLLEEVVLWIEWGAKLDLSLDEVKAGIDRNIGYIAILAPIPSSASKILEAFGMPENEAHRKVEHDVYYTMMM